MRFVRSVLSSLLIASSGLSCGALIGLGELEKTDCVDCDGGLRAESPSPPDARAEAASNLHDDDASAAANDAAGQSVEACVATPPRCDGLAHACDGVVNKGCPAAIGSGAPQSESKTAGDISFGTSFSDTCPDGEVLVGMAGVTNGWLEAIRGICGAISVDEDRATNPFTYTVKIGTGTVLPTRGSSNPTTWTARCPADQTVVAMSGRDAMYIDGLTLECAPLQVIGQHGAFGLKQGTATPLPYVGGTGGSPFARFACPDPQVVRLVAGKTEPWTPNASTWGVNALKIGCETPRLTLR